MGTEQSKFTQLIRSTEFLSLNTAIAEVMLRRFNYVLSPYSEENLTRHRECLADGSLVLYLNHITREDPFLAGALSVSTLRGQLRGVLAPIGARHYREFGNKNPIYAALLNHIHLTGIEVLPVPQPYYGDEFTGSETTRMNRNFVRSARDVLGQKGGMLVITPEGTRSPDGRLQEAQPGIEHLEKFGERVHFVPWGMIPLEPYDREDGLGKVEVNIGIPHVRQEIEARWDRSVHGSKMSFADMLMADLAARLPRKMQGAYSGFFSEWDVLVTP